MYLANMVSFLCSFCSFVIFVNYVECILVETKQGKILGQTEISRGGRDFYAFYGIPYAEPPVGELRLESPVPAKNWEGILNATNFPPMCLSNRGPTIYGQEDCLYLNIYTPKIEKNSLLPVLVFIFGGNFMYGHALPNRYGPHYFMDKDVIVVTFHYRMGPLGFLSTADEVMPGNYGFKDVVEVLRWVQKNIESYGGDKNRVTLGGGSSAGTTTLLTLLSPLAKGLFHRCIIQSPLPRGVMQGPEYHRKTAWKFASFTDCRNENISTSKDLKSCLKKLPAKEIAKHTEKLYTLGTIIPDSPYAPSVENEKMSGAFLIDQPSKLLEGNIDIPIIIGVNSGEGGMVTIFSYMSANPKTNVASELEKNYQKHFPELFYYANNYENSNSLKEKTNSVVSRYFEMTKIGENPFAFAQLYTDLFITNIINIIKKYKATKYAYYYDHRNEESFDKYYGSTSDIDMGVLHGDELISMFNWSEAIKPINKGVDLIVSEQVLDLWTNFITYGDPNGLGPIIWNPTESENFSYLHIKNGELKMETELRESEYAFWRSIQSEGEQ